MNMFASPLNISYLFLLSNQSSSLAISTTSVVVQLDGVMVISLRPGLMVGLLKGAVQEQSLPL